MNAQQLIVTTITLFAVCAGSVIAYADTAPSAMLGDTPEYALINPNLLNISDEPTEQPIPTDSPLWPDTSKVSPADTYHFINPHFIIPPQQTATIDTVPVDAMPADPSDEAIPAVPSPETASLNEAVRVVINIPSRTMDVFRGEKRIRRFPVGLGRPGFMTPIGEFKVIRKISHPTWENPYLAQNAMTIAPGSDNPLGTRWIGFHRDGKGEYGMHGTNRPQSVGHYSSHGCVRMKIPDVEALFDLVELGTPVTVTYDTVLDWTKGETIYVTPMPDTFHRGRLSTDKLYKVIATKYPGAQINRNKLTEALRLPGKATPVGQRANKS